MPVTSEVSVSSPVVPKASEAPASSGAEVLLGAGDGPECRGRVHRFQGQLTEVWVPRGESSCLPIGAGVELRLDLPGLRGRLTCRSTVEGRTDTGSTSRYELRLPRLGEPGGAVTAALGAVFNRRGSWRVRPEPLAHVPVCLRAPDRPLAVRGPLADISSGGLAVRLDADVEERFADVDRVWVSLQLPETDEPVRLGAAIRSRRLCGRQVRYGLQFDESAGPWASPSLRSILGYVMQRQRDTLRPAAPDPARRS